MNCDRALSSLATGGRLLRWRAARHAARCPRCAVAAGRTREIAAELAAVPELTSAQRSLWSIARGEERPARPSLVRTFGPALIAASACALALAWFATRHVWSPVRPRVTPGVVAPRPVIAASPRLEAMRIGLDSAATELALLRRRADLLDARKDADALWLLYARRDPGRRGDEIATP